jgi:hypothetical protein
MIIYNWISVPVMVVAVIPYLLYLTTGATSSLMLVHVTYIFGLGVSWYVAKAGLETTVPVAFAFLLADFALTYGLDALIR